MVGINDARIHDLRHNYVSLLIQNGISLYEVQKLLGHSSPYIVKRYAHLKPISLKQIVDTLPSFFYKTAPFTGSPLWQFVSMRVR